MDCSVIICTRNQAESLKATLESIGKVTVPQGWAAELLVVDNGSNDSTKAMVSSITLPNIPIRYVQEPRIGKGYAYNSGMAAASGQIFVFTDDDVRVPSNWIDGMCRPILNGGADAVAGGVVFPAEYTEALSRQELSSRRSWFASTEVLDPHRPSRMVGANMAFHRRVLDKVPGFDIELGPGALGFEDETLFSRQLQAAGCRLVGAFDVAVEHHFDLTRTTRAGLLDTARKKGRSNAFVFHHWEHQTSRLIVPRLLVYLQRRQWVRFTGWLTGNPDELISGTELRMEEKVAFCREYIAQRRRPRKYSLQGLAPLVR
jgi:glycosyltransferase involved in cell wall biosynthesis